MASLLLLCFAYTTRAIDPSRDLSHYIRDRWGSSKGFPGGQVYAITQTPDGYLWIGAEKGLVRFDGLKFHLFQNANTPVIPVGPIRNLVADAEGNLWIHLGGPKLLRYANGKFEDVSSLFPQAEPAFTAMARGAKGEMLISSLVNGTLRYINGKFVKLADAPELPNFLVISLAESPDGKLWLGTRDLGLFHATPGDVFNIGRPLPDRKINCLLPITNEELLIGTDNGIVRWNGVEITNLDVSSSRTKVQALTMIKDRDANVWVGTNIGLIRVGPQGTVAFSQRAGDSVPVTALFEDREGNLWAGTSHGIERLRESVFVTYSSEGVPTENNGPVYLDGESRIWFGPAAGGLYWRKGETVERVKSAGLDNDVIYSITGDETGLWIGRQKGGLTHLSYKDGSFKAKTYTEAQGLAQNSVYAVHHNRDGSVWAGTLSGGVSHFSGGKFRNYTTRDGLASNTIDAIVETADGTMWFATPNGLSALSNDSWQIFKVQNGLPSDRVNCLFEDSTRQLWVGTDGGLSFLGSGRFHTPKAVPASLHEPVLGLVADNTGWFWIATTNHVLRVRPDSLRNDRVTENVREFGVADGLNGSEGVRRNRSVTIDPSGMVWFSLNSGLSVVDPNRLRKRSVPAIVHVNAVAADGNPVELSGTIRIPSARKRIAFSFAGLSLAIPERVKFRYKLDPLDQQWSDPVSAGEAVYNNLAPGSYRFLVLASNSDGFWNGPPGELVFEIAPAFWQTWWFRVLGLVTLVLIGLALYRIHLLQITRQLNVRFEERLAERTLIAQELHDTLLQGFLSASMQLDVAVDQLPGNSPVRTRLERVLNLMREVIEEGRNAIRGVRLSNNGSSQDIGVALSNISQELNSEGETVYRVIVEGSPRTLHPIVRDEVYRIGREAVVNAFRHSRAKHITVEVSYLENQLRLLIRDDGCGINSEVLESGRDGHWGLSGMRERAERINARLKVRSRVGSGTDVELSVPTAVAFQDQPARPRWWFGNSRHQPQTSSIEASKSTKQ